MGRAWMIIVRIIIDKISIIMTIVIIKKQGHSNQQAGGTDQAWTETIVVGLFMISINIIIIIKPSAPTNLCIMIAHLGMQDTVLRSPAQEKLKLNNFNNLH